MPAGDPSSLDEILERLEVPRGHLLYVQSSLDWIERAGIRPADVLPALLAWTGAQGTLVMPSYPFSGFHRAYLETAPTFDVRRTPSAIGLLPEIFRRTKLVARSLDPDFCVAALGPQAGMIVNDTPATLDPFGTDSSYQRMIDLDVVLVGLGVSLNTTSFIHAIDSRAAASYPSPVYDSRRYDTRVIDGAGTRHDVARIALNAPFQKLTEPSNVIDEMKPSAAEFGTFEINGARFFRWRLRSWAQWCLAHAASRAASGAWPCWLSRLASADV